jgi:hypothetical protein
LTEGAKYVKIGGSRDLSVRAVRMIQGTAEEITADELDMV